MTREEMIQQLKKGVCIVNSMMFTLNPDYLPSSFNQETSLEGLNETITDNLIVAVDVIQGELVTIPIELISSFQKV